MLNIFLTLFCSVFTVIVGILLVIEAVKDIKQVRKMSKYVPIQNSDMVEIIWPILVGSFLISFGVGLPFLYL